MTLNNTESLLLAQAAFELGASPKSWSAISRILSKHPLINRPKSFFTPAVCSSLYDQILSQSGLQRTDENNAIKADVNLALAKRYFKLRYDELYRLIKEEEVKFKSIISELDEIRAGKWDARIKSQLTGEAQTNDEHSPMTVDETTRDEASLDPHTVIDESALSVEEEERSDSSEERAHTPPEDSEQNEVEMEEDEEVEAPQEESDATSVTREGPANDSAGEDGESSGEDEPLQTVRRSTRRKSSVGAAPKVRATRRQQRQMQLEEEEEEAPPSPDSECVNDDAKDDSSAEENMRSSPFEATANRTREGKRKASYVESLDANQRDSKRLREDSEYADSDLGSPAHGAHTRSRPTRGGARSEEQAALKRFQTVIGLLHSQISQHRNGTIFHNPIKVTEAPDYHEIVKRPMDLKTIKARVKDGLITNSLEFQRDVYLMFANAMMYNRPSSDVYTMAEDMMFDAERQIHSFRQTEAFGRGIR